MRQLIEGERNLQGFMNAYLSLDPYYLVAPEMEFSHGYCDFFLLPNDTVYPMVKHSYILELKYLKADATEAEADKQWSEALEQVKTYAADKKLQSMLHGTQLVAHQLRAKGGIVDRRTQVAADPFGHCLPGLGSIAQTVGDCSQQSCLASET